MNPIKTERKQWQLKAQDFGGSRIHAEQDWRFQMFFEYLRISPSYTLAMKCKNVGQLEKLLGDKHRAEAVWKTYKDAGNVFETYYREWWLRRGINIFGIHSARPRVEYVQRISAPQPADDLLAKSCVELKKFISTRYKSQGIPESLLVSIPLRMKRTTIMRQLKLILDANIPSQCPPKRVIELENNKMRYKRLLAGLKLVYMKAARPNDELWRAATRAKISKTHNALNPNAEKKAAKTGVERRILTIMASRLMRDVLIIAENAAHGKFPTLNPVASIPFDFNLLGKQIQQINHNEKLRKEQLLAKNKANQAKSSA